MKKETQMEKTKLGRTGLDVSKLALGGLFMMSGTTDISSAKKAVRGCIERGINYIDTAPNYGDSEEVLGKCLAGVDEPLILSTKLGGRPQPFDPKDKALLRASLEESLKLLHRTHIDILMIHEPDRPGQYDWWTDMLKVEGPVLELMDELKKEGLIRYTGLGGTTAYELAHLVRSGKFDVVLTAFNYSLLWREAENAIFPAARENNVGVIAGSPLQQGALNRVYNEIFDDDVYWLSPARKEQFRALYKLVEESGMSIAEMAMRFVISNPSVNCVLTGVRNMEEADENIKAIDAGPLPSDILARLDEIGKLVPFRPYEEPSGLGWRISNPKSYKGPGGL